MVHYDVWCNLKDSSKDLEFTERLSAYLGMMQERGAIEGYSLKRRMLGLGPSELGEFNVTIMLKDLAQLDKAFTAAASRGPGIEPLHKAVYSEVRDLTFGLSRDFPDDVRIAGEIVKQA